MLTWTSAWLILSLLGCPPKKAPADVVTTEEQAVGVPGTTPGAPGVPVVVETPETRRAALEQKANAAVALLTTGTVEDARRAVKSLMELETELPEEASIPFNLGIAYESIGQAAMARNSYQRATAKNPKLAAAWVRLGLLEEQQGNYGAALQIYRMGIQYDPADSNLRVSEVGALISLGQYDQAVQCAQSALKLNANALNVYANLGLAYIQQGKLDLAKFIYQRALQYVPGADNNPDIHVNLGRIHYLQGFYSSARSEYQKALQLDPTNLPAMVFLSEYYIENRAYDEVVPLLERARVIAPNDVAVRMNLGVGYRGIGRYQEAQKEYEAVLALDPRKHEPYINLAILQGDYLKTYDAAIGTLEKYKAEPGADVAKADAWISEIKSERQRADEKERRRKDLEEQRKKREEEDRRLKELEEKVRLEKERNPEGVPAPAGDPGTGAPAAPSDTPATPPPSTGTDPAAAPTAPPVPAGTEPAATPATPPPAAPAGWDTGAAPAATEPASGTTSSGETGSASGAAATGWVVAPVENPPPSTTEGGTSSGEPSAGEKTGGQP